MEPAEPGRGAGQQDFDALLAVAGRGTNVTVLGRADVGRSAAEPLQAITLTPGRRPASSTPFSDTSIVVTQAIRTDFGFYYLADDTGRVARYRPNFRRDVGFAVRSAGRADRVPDALVADANGRCWSSAIGRSSGWCDAVRRTEL